MKGKVKFFNESKGFGFITGDDGKDYFVHHSALPEGARLRDNDEVSFEIEQGDRGPKAVNVSLDSGDAAPAKKAPAKKAAPADDEDLEDSDEDLEDDSEDED